MDIVETILLLDFCVLVPLVLLIGVAILMMLPSGVSRSSETSDIRRIGDETIGGIRRTSSAFRDHIDRETRR